MGGVMGSVAEVGGVPRYSRGPRLRSSSSGSCRRRALNEAMYSRTRLVLSSSSSSSSTAWLSTPAPLSSFFEAGADTSSSSTLSRLPCCLSPPPLSPLPTKGFLLPSRPLCGACPPLSVGHQSCEVSRGCSMDTPSCLILASTSAIREDMCGECGEYAYVAVLGGVAGTSKLRPKSRLPEESRDGSSVLPWW